ASFDGASAVSTTTVVTDSTGVANFLVHVGEANGSFQLIAEGRDAVATLNFLALNVGGVAHQPNTNTKLTLNVADLGIQTSTPLYFIVKNTSDQPLAGVPVQFSLGTNSAAGCAVSPTSAVSNAMGIVQTVLTSGDSGGLATVQATVVGRPPASSPAFNIY